MVTIGPNKNYTVFCCVYYRHRKYNSVNCIAQFIWLTCINVYWMRNISASVFNSSSFHPSVCVRVRHTHVISYRLRLKCSKMQNPVRNVNDIIKFEKRCRHAVEQLRFEMKRDYFQERTFIVE